MACGWTPNYAGCTADQAVIDGWPEGLKDAAETMASDLLNSWTGGLYGSCAETIRPCREVRPPSNRALHEFRETTTGDRLPWNPVMVDGSWYSIGCGSCGNRCGCDGPATLSLPWPVESITSVTIDGILLSADAYRVDRKRLLVRTDGGGWPATQNMAAAPGEPDTFVIEYMHGIPVPVGGQIAAGILAMELGKALCDDNTCRLPERVQTVTRQGVTVAMLDSFEGIESGRTGIWTVDSWVASVTEGPRRSTVMSPDYRRRR